jgi:hypothetical protein
LGVVTLSRRCLKTLERVKGIEPSYSAWKSDAFARFFNGFSDRSQPNTPIDFKRQFCAVRTRLRLLLLRSLGLRANTFAYANRPVEIAVICEGFRRGKQQAGVAEVSQQSLYAL